MELKCKDQNLQGGAKDMLTRLESQSLGKTFVYHKYAAVYVLT